MEIVSLLSVPWTTRVNVPTLSALGCTYAEPMDTCGVLWKLLDRSLALATRELSGANPKRLWMVLKMDKVSCSVWSAKPILEYGEMTMAGTRLPSPQRPLLSGAETWSHRPPFSS